MLVDPKLRKADPFIAMVTSMISSGAGGSNPTRIEKGIYQIGHFSFDTLISEQGGNLREHDEWDDGMYLDVYDKLPEGLDSCYGVHDSIDAFLEQFRDKLEESEEEWCVAFTEIRKDQQPDEGGWRWHKWGTYIGKHEPQYEYLHDEPDIESIVVFHIYMRKPKSWLS